MYDGAARAVQACVSAYDEVCSCIINFICCCFGRHLVIITTTASIIIVHGYHFIFLKLIYFSSSRVRDRIIAEVYEALYRNEPEGIAAKTHVQSYQYL
jgi:hypothetical protein